jgi:hypothetical protein
MFFQVLIIPLLMGLLANLAIEMPIHVSMDKRPDFHFHRMWIIGCVLLSGWFRLVISLSQKLLISLFCRALCILIVCSLC